jgi:hypothetical protein
MDPRAGLDTHTYIHSVYRKLVKMTAGYGIRHTAIKILSRTRTGYVKYNDVDSGLYWIYSLLSLQPQHSIITGNTLALAVL